MKCVRNAAKLSHACLVDCPESRYSEQLLLSSHGEKLQGLWIEGSPDGRPHSWAKSRLNM